MKRLIFLLLAAASLAFASCKSGGSGNPRNADSTSHFEGDGHDHHEGDGHEHHDGDGHDHSAPEEGRQH